MRKIILLMILLVPLFTMAQYQFKSGDNRIYQLLSNDTLTDVDEVIGTFPDVLGDGWHYSVQMVADSLSGATDATAYLQQCNSTGGDHYTTITSGSQAIDGVQTEKLWDGTFWYGAKLRLKVISTGTQSTRVNAWLVLKK